MRLFLHIGTEKTATTTIQFFLYHNREILNSRGIILSDVLGKPNNRKLPAFCIPEESFDDYFTNRRITTIEQKKEHFSSFISDFEREVRSCSTSADAMVITSEQLHSRLTGIDSILFLKTILDDLFSEVIIVCYFREQSAVVKSLYSTMVRASSGNSFDTLLRQCNPNNPYYNYYESLNKWSSVFGKNYLVPRIFSTNTFHEGDIRKDILKIIDKDFNAANYDYSIDDQNKSLGFVGLELGRVNNLVNERYLADGSINTLRSRIQRIIDASEISQKGRVAFPSASEIYKKFTESNLAFAEKFLGINTNPFSPPVTNNYEESSEEEFISDPLFLDFLKFFEEFLIEMRSIPFIEDRTADTLRDLAIKAEKQERLGLREAKDLMELALKIRPSGPFIKRKLNEYERRLVNNSDDS